MDSHLIGQKVRALRAKQGLTTVTLARKVGLSQAQVSRLENGLQGWRTATLAQFARALKVEPTFFLVAGEEVKSANVAQELEEAGLVASDRLVKALRDPGFFKFMDRCAKSANAHKKGLQRMRKALRGLV